MSENESERMLAVAAEVFKRMMQPYIDAAIRHIDANIAPQAGAIEPPTPLYSPLRQFTTIINESPVEPAVLSQIPYDTVRAAVMAYQDIKGAHAASEVLKRFKAKYITDLKADPSQYQAVLDALQ